MQAEIVPIPVVLDFLGSETCAECHQQAYSEWQGSHHQQAMAIAGPETLLGAFDGQTFDLNGETLRFSETADSPQITALDADGQTRTFDVTHVFGVDPMQQLIVDYPDGRGQLPTMAWDTRPVDQGGQNWFSLYPDETIPSGDPLHWTGPLNNWNSQCAECHSTGLKKQYSASNDSYETIFEEISVGCEACHGRGSRHVAWARDPAGESRYARNHGLELGLAGGGASWVMNNETGIAQRQPALKRHPQAEACGRCHSRRTQQTDDYRYGKPLLDTHRVALLRDPLYFPDGQVREEVYVYGSFLQSKMYQAGVDCTDCHEPHSAKLKAEGDAICEQCHLGTKFASTEHHQHQPDQVQCVDCHMPERIYMVIDGRRDHSFRVPRPDLTRSIGAPNACASCHDDQPTAWLSAAVERWYPSGRQNMPHYGQALFEAWSGAGDAYTDLKSLIESDEPAIVRASALLALPGFITDPSRLAPVIQGSRDPEAIVRFAAMLALDGLPTQATVPIAGPLLTDTIRNVRIEAARSLAAAEGQLPPEQAAAFGRAADELIASERFNLDREFSYLNLGNFQAARGQLAQAEHSFQDGLEFAPGSATIRVNLADIHRRKGDDEQALLVLKEALSIDPDSPLAREALVLTLVRQSRYDDAIIELEEGIRRTPGSLQLRYLLVLALDHVSNKEKARAELESLRRDFPDSPQVQSLELQPN